MDTQSLLDQTAEAVLKRVDTAPLKTKAVLVTGSTGLIGGNLRATLLKTGCHLVGTTSRTLTFRGRDRYDYIVHAAGYAQPAKFLMDPMSTIDVNTSMLASLILRLKDGGRLLFLSTSEVYSGNPRSLYREEDIGATNPAHERGCYIESKRCGEAICHAARAAGTTAIIARVSSVYGPGVRAKDSRVMSQFIDSAIRAGEIALKDGGQARRVFLYVSDAVEMLLNILLRGSGAVYNVGGPASLTGRHGESWNNTLGEVSILGLAKKIAQLTDAEVRAPAYKERSGAAMAGAPAHAGLDMSRYTREFPKEQWVSLEEGLKHTIAWHRELARSKAMVAA